jgi:hypothetical protein
MHYLNLCRGCDTDFASVAAFDRHHTGTRDYTFREDLAMDPSRDDGRRCLDPDEMLEAGMKVDPSGRWRVALSEAAQYRLKQLSGTASSMPLGAKGVARERFGGSGGLGHG